MAHPGFSAVMEVGPGRYELAATAYRLSHRAPVRRAPGGAAGAGFAAGSVTAGSYHLLLPNVKININPGRQNLSIGPVYPDGTARTMGFLDYYFGPDADEAWIEQMMAFDTEVGDQDAALVAAPRSRRVRELDRPQGGSSPRSGCSPTSSVTCTPPVPANCPGSASGFRRSCGRPARAAG